MEIFLRSVPTRLKKAFFHFYPRTKSLTVGSWSCNFTCPWCQNDNISKLPENIGKGQTINPEKLIELLEKNNCQGTCILSNEPTLFLEYFTDVFRLAKKGGIIIPK